MTTTYIGIGSNLNAPIEQVQTAIINLSTLPNTTVLNKSSLYQSRPLEPAGIVEFDDRLLGRQDQADYINAVVALETTLSAEELLKALQAIEKKQGRVRNGERWGPRVIDLDILLYGDDVIQNDILSIPHPELTVREFVLYPLAEIAKDLIVPMGESVSVLKTRCSGKGIKRLSI